MKSKAYTFTEDEMEAIRDALVENFIRLRNHMLDQKDPSPRLRKMVSTLEALKEQFKTDCAK